MTANKMPEMPFSPYLISEWTGPEMTDRKTWTAYTADQMRAMYLAGIAAARGELPVRLHGENAWVAGHNACRATTLANLTALEQEAKK